MKKIIFILTLVILLKPIFPIVEYVVNYEYISKVLCVNKKSPMMHCDGKCYLISKLAKSAEDSDPITGKKNASKEVEILFFQEVKTIKFLKELINLKFFLNVNYCNLYKHLNTDNILRPPIIIS